MTAKRFLGVVATVDALLIGHMPSQQRNAAPTMSYFTVQHVFSRDVDQQDLEYAAKLDGLGEDARRELGLYAARILRDLTCTHGFTVCLPPMCVAAAVSAISRRWTVTTQACACGSPRMI